MAGGAELRAVLKLVGETDPSLKKVIRDAAREAANLNKKGAGIGQGFAAGGNVAKSALSGLGKAAGAAIKGVSTAMVAAGTATIALGAAATRVGSEFEAGMSQVAATMGETMESADVQKLTELAKDMGKTTKFTASEAADALNYMALAGWDALQMEQAMPSVLNLAAAGGMEIAAASDVVTDSLAALGLGFDNLEPFVDQMSKTSQKTNTNVEQLGEAILTVGGTAKGLQGGMTEMNAALGIMANVGVKGSEGGTALRNTILSLTNASGPAAKQLAAMGISVADAEGNMRALPEIMSDINKGMDGLGSAERSQVLGTIFNKRDLKAIEGLLGTTESEWESLMNTIEDSSGSAEAQAKTLLDNLKGDMTLFQSALEGLGVEVYMSELNGGLRDAVKTATGFIDQLTGAFTKGGIEGLVAELGNVGAQAATMIAQSAPKMVSTGANMVRSFITGIKNNQGEITSAAVSAGTLFIQEVLSLAPEILNAGFNMITDLVAGVAQNGQAIATSAMQAVTSLLQNIAANGPRLMAGGYELIRNLASGIGQNLRQLVVSGVDMVTSLAGGLASSIPDIVSAAFDIAAGLIDAFLSINWGAVGVDILISLGAGLIDGIAELGGKVISTVAGWFGKEFEVSEFSLADTWDGFKENSEFSHLSMYGKMREGEDAAAAAAAGSADGAAYNSAFEQAANAGGVNTYATQSAEEIAGSYAPAQAAAADFSATTDAAMTDYSAAMMVAGMDTAAFSAQTATDMTAVQTSVTTAMQAVKTETQTAFTAMQSGVTSFVASMQSAIQTATQLAQAMVLAAAATPSGAAAGGGARAPMAHGGILRATPGGVPVTAAEAGHDEAFIPITRTPRSIGLLTETAARLGITLGGGTQAPVNISYNPRITVMGNASKSDIVAALAEDREGLFSLLDDYYAERRRTSFGSKFANAD